MFKSFLYVFVYDFSYNKTEDLTPGSADMLSFSHLMIGALSDNRSELAPYVTTHTVLHTVSSYSGLRLSWKEFPFLHIKTKETLWILKKFTGQRSGRERTESLADVILVDEELLVISVVCMIYLGTKVDGY